MASRRVLVAIIALALCLVAKAQLLTPTTLPAIDTTTVVKSFLEQRAMTGICAKVVPGVRQQLTSHRTMIKQVLDKHVADIQTSLLETRRQMMSLSNPLNWVKNKAKTIIKQLKKPLPLLKAFGKGLLKFGSCWLMALPRTIALLKKLVKEKTCKFPHLGGVGRHLGTVFNYAAKNGLKSFRNILCKVTYFAAELPIFKCPPFSWIVKISKMIGKPFVSLIGKVGKSIKRVISKGMKSNRAYWRRVKAVETQMRRDAKAISSSKSAPRISRTGRRSSTKRRPSRKKRKRRLRKGLKPISGAFRRARNALRRKVRKTRSIRRRRRRRVVRKINRSVRKVRRFKRRVIGGKHRKRALRKLKLATRKINKLVRRSKKRRRSRTVRRVRKSIRRATKRVRNRLSRRRNLKMKIPVRRGPKARRYRKRLGSFTAVRLAVRNIRKTIPSTVRNRSNRLRRHVLTRKRHPRGRTYRRRLYRSIRTLSKLRGAHSRGINRLLKLRKNKNKKTKRKIKRVRRTVRRTVKKIRKRVKRTRFIRRTMSRRASQRLAYRRRRWRSLKKRKCNKLKQQSARLRRMKGSAALVALRQVNFLFSAMKCRKYVFLEEESHLNSAEDQEDGADSDSLVLVEQHSERAKAIREATPTFSGVPEEYVATYPASFKSSFKDNRKVAWLQSECNKQGARAAFWIYHLCDLTIDSLEALPNMKQASKWVIIPQAFCTVSKAIVQFFKEACVGYDIAHIKDLAQVNNKHALYQFVYSMELSRRTHIVRTANDEVKNAVGVVQTRCAETSTTLDGLEASLHTAMTK